jgi:hypothetical protein
MKGLNLKIPMNVTAVDAEKVSEYNVKYKRRKSMVTKRGTTRKKVVEPPTPSKSFPTAALGIGMVILTNYQAEVKQILTLIVRALT